jgi:hypothetical protein
VAERASGRAGPGAVRRNRPGREFEAATGLREYLEDRVWSLTAQRLPPGEGGQRRALVASQLVGLAWTRYLLRLEPLASARPEEVARWIRPDARPVHAGATSPSQRAVSSIGLGGRNQWRRTRWLRPRDIPRTSQKEWLPD